MSTYCDWRPNPRRALLVRLLALCQTEGSTAVGWEISKVDEALLFEFVCPSTETRSRSFRLCNLPVTWGTDFSSLVLTDGKRRSFDLWHLVDGGMALPDVFRQILPNVRGARGGDETSQSSFDRLLADFNRPPVKPQTQPTSVPYDL